MGNDIYIEDNSFEPVSVMPDRTSKRYNYSAFKEIKNQILTNLNYLTESELLAIEGSVPDVTDLPKGCAFCERCSFAMNICLEYDPELKIIEDKHYSACWLNDSRSKKNLSEVGGNTFG